MSFLVFLLLVASGVLAEVTESTNGSIRPTQPTVWEAQALPDQLTIVPHPVYVEKFASGTLHKKPRERVCLKQVKCFESDPETSEELQRDEEFKDGPSSPEGAGKKIPCPYTVQEETTYYGYCIRRGRKRPQTICIAGKLNSFFVPACWPLLLDP